ncbi:4-diphosphocytidyl-2-C-methyl-D-erythritol kinase [Rosistilla carotiformis]|uniref:4-diphosphocytidyl-2-C-methyl-D-erythritol kinase n=1 Tax=Rosistilla carotiformis TaxID=2528017 RepID=A0A518JX52_9BACT|nr:4-(cytidine 5'-diphospho)-2-C-methyl-D-erythritol kinase [Rosistilla carotiformis]QDV70130.1 4-diphosphocytidyl-2-C-methyl-D-erythritol kinase [Rosistilla carotiformis]
MLANQPPAVEILTPAKLNLFLELRERRADGFHELETVMVAINRFDRVRMAFTETDDVHVDCHWLPNQAVVVHRYRGAQTVAALPSSQHNLVTRTLEQFRQRFSIAKGFRATVAKTIPAGAGMGGASSDAAAALRAAAQLCDIAPHEPRLLQLAGEMGSDIPFFFGASDGPMTAAIATGRGEQIASIPVGGKLHFVVVHPPASVSTVEVYRRCQVPPEPVSATAMLAAMVSGRAARIAGQLLNRLADPSRATSDWIDRVLTAIRRTSVLGYQVTGSGSACFGICPNAATASRIAHQLQATGVGIAFAAESVQIANPSRDLGSFL